MFRLFHSLRLPQDAFTFGQLAISLIFGPYFPIWVSPSLLLGPWITTSLFLCTSGSQFSSGLSNLSSSLVHIFLAHFHVCLLVLVSCQWILALSSQSSFPIFLSLCQTVFVSWRLFFSPCLLLWVLQSLFLVLVPLSFFSLSTYLVYSEAKQQGCIGTIAFLPLLINLFLLVLRPRRLVKSTSLIWQPIFNKRFRIKPHKSQMDFRFQAI